MLKYEQVAGIIRFYPSHTEESKEFQDYVASCTVVWETDKVIWLKGLTGQINRRHIASLIRFILDQGIEKVKAQRSSGLLPFATHVDGNYYEVDVATAKDKGINFINKYAAKVKQEA